MPFNLKDLCFKEISVVDSPANQGARIVLFKRDATAEELQGVKGYAQKVEALGVLVRAGFKPEAACKVVGLPNIPHTGTLPITVQGDETGGVFKRMIAALGKALGWPTDRIAKMESEAQTFDEAYMQRKYDRISSDMYDAYSAFCQAMYSIVYSTDANKAALIRTALTQFSESLAGEIDGWLTDGGLEKTLDPATITRLQSMQKHVTQLLSAAQEVPMQIDKSKLAPEVLALIEKQEAEIAELKKTAKPAETKPEDVLKGLSPEARAIVEKAQKDAADAVAKAEASEKIAKEEREARILKEYQEKAGEFVALAIDPVKDAPVLKAIHEKLSKEDAARVMELKELGADGTSGAGSSAYAEIETLAKAKISKGEAKTMPEAIEAVSKEKPELYQKYQEEKQAAR
jgi:hypothetical protein